MWLMRGRGMACRKGNARCASPIGQWNSAISCGTQSSRYFRNNFKLNACIAQFFGFFTGPAKYRRISAFQADDFFPGASAFKHERMKRGNNPPVSTAMAHIHKLGITGGQR
jgi:hypothetical protein